MTNPFDLWNEHIGPDSYGGSKEKYQDAVLKQYKLYSDLTDRVSARAPIVDTFFLTINTAAIALIGVVWTGHDQIRASSWLLVIPLVPLLANCNIWWNIIQSRRRILAAKTQVIVALEERLPAQPLGTAEWKAYQTVHPGALRTPKSLGLQWIPIAFALLYIGGFIAALLQ
jgi:hypothetical protein